MKEMDALTVVGRKFLRADWRSGYGDEPPWTIGEPRTIDGPIALCVRGYHWSPSWYDALGYACGNVAAVVRASEPVQSDDSKAVSRSLRVVAAVDVAEVLRLWGIDCAERTLIRLRETGRDPDPRCWATIETARRYVRGEASRAEIDAAWDAAWAAAWAAARDAAGAAAWDAAWAAARDAARDAARAAAWAAARDAAGAAAGDAAGDAARDAEVLWQRARLDELLDATIRAAFPDALPAPGGEVTP